MVSVERVLGYCRVPQEASLESEPGCKPKEDWPAEGNVDVRVCAEVHAILMSKETPLLSHFSLPFCQFVSAVLLSRFCPANVCIPSFPHPSCPSSFLSFTPRFATCPCGTARIFPLCSRA